MTVVPDMDAGSMTLICDGCGSLETAPLIAHDGDVVWPLVSAAGWTGSAFATGTHRCPRCTERPPAPIRQRSATLPVQGPAFDRRVIEGLETTILVPKTDVGIEIAETLRQALAKEIQERRYVVIDMRAAEAIDSAGLGLLVRTHQEAKQQGRFLALVAPSRYVLTVLHTMKLDGVFDIFDDVQEALACVRAHPSRNRHTTAR